VQDSFAFTVNLKFSAAQTAGHSPTFAIGSSTLQAQLTATVPGLTASATVGFFHAQASDDPSSPSAVSLTYATTFSTNTSGNVIISSATSGSANVNLLLSAGFGSDPVNDPTVTANFHLGWTFSNADPARSGLFGNTPSIAFNNVQLHVGSFVGDFLGSVVSYVQQVTKPLEPLAEVLLTPIPVLSDLSQDIGGGPIYLTDLLGSSAGSAITSFARAVEVINSLDPKKLSDGVVNLGSFTISDPRANDSAGDSTPAAILQNSPASDVIQQVSSLSAGSATFFNQLSMLGSSQGFHFTILDNPTNAFNLLLGKDTPLFTYTLPSLSVSTSVGTDIPVYPGVVIHFGGTLSLAATATFGCDTSGLRSGNALDGFFLDNASVTVSFTVTVGAGIGIPDLLSLTVDGNLGVSATFTLTGTDGSTHVTASQFASGQVSVAAAGDLIGSLSIDLTGPFDVDLYSFTLASFDQHIF
jgi:hypothetical protein